MLIEWEKRNYSSAEDGTGKLWGNTRKHESMKNPLGRTEDVQYTKVEKTDRRRNEKYYKFSQ